MLTEPAPLAIMSMVRQKADVQMQKSGDANVDLLVATKTTGMLINRWMRAFIFEHSAI